MKEKMNHSLDNIIHESGACVLDARSKKLRRDIIGMMNAGGRGHLASAFSLVEILRTLYDKTLSYQSDNPNWENRDRFILSKGHGCMALYVMLAEKGFILENDLGKFCAIDGILGGHPETIIPGVEASTGSLGHGLSIGIGMALHAKQVQKKHRVFVVLGDGEMNEGSIWEGALSASKHCLDNLVVLIDYNKQQSYSFTSEVLSLEPLEDKWKSFGFHCLQVNGHDCEAIEKAIDRSRHIASKPSVVICHTIKGKGVSFVEQNLEWHHKSNVSTDILDELYNEL